nr:molecular chaperone DnaK [Ipomoea batatas]
MYIAVKDTLGIYELKFLSSPCYFSRLVPSGSNPQDHYKVVSRRALLSRGFKWLIRITRSPLSMEDRVCKLEAQVEMSMFQISRMRNSGSFGNLDSSASPLKLNPVQKRLYSSNTNSVEQMEKSVRKMVGKTPNDYVNPDEVFALEAVIQDGVFDGE